MNKILVSSDIMNKFSKIIITAKFKVKRSTELMTFLLEKLNTSRNNVKHLLSNKQVLVNGRQVSQFNYPLASEDEVALTKNPVYEEQKTESRKEKKEKNTYLDIIYEDSDFIAINKPAGLLAVLSDKELEETAYNLVSLYLRPQKKRPYVIHRIDKETSGVLVFTTNIKLQSRLRLDWNKYVKFRGYIAICEGTLENKQGTIKNYLAQNQYNLVYVSNNPSDKLAITNYRVLKENKNASLLDINIDTGRKNQIRVAFANLGHPILGDDKYGHKETFKRLALHASRLTFVNPYTNKEIDIKAKTPSIFYSLFK